MIRRSPDGQPSCLFRAFVPLLGVFATLAAGEHASAQTSSEQNEQLRDRIESRYDVLVTDDTVALRPKAADRSVRWIEVTGASVTIDGNPVTGAELRNRIGEDADLIIPLTYMEHDVRRRLFARPGALPPAPVEAPSPPRPPAPPAAPGSGSDDGPDRPRRSGERVRIAGSVTVEEDELILGDVVAVGGGATVLGEVRGSVVAVGGSVELGPRAVVRSDVTVVGGTLRRSPTARIGGEIHEVGFGWFSGDIWRGRGPVPDFWRNGFRSGFALFSTLTRFAILCLLAALVVLLGREQVEAISARAAAEPVKAGAIGLLSQLLFLPLLVVTIVVLIITIIGIPLLFLIPFVILGLGIVALVGFTAVAYRLGGLLSNRLGWTGLNPYTTTLAGVALVLSPILLARLVSLAGSPVAPMTFGLGLVGAIAEYLVWTIGFGAVALARFSRPAGVALVAQPGA